MKNNIRGNNNGRNTYAGGFSNRSGYSNHANTGGNFSHGQQNQGRSQNIRGSNNQFQTAGTFTSNRGGAAGGFHHASGQSWQSEGRGQRWQSEGHNDTREGTSFRGANSQTRNFSPQYGQNPTPFIGGSHQGAYRGGSHQGAGDHQGMKRGGYHHGGHDHYGDHRGGNHQGMQREGGRNYQGTHNPQGSQRWGDPHYKGRGGGSEMNQQGNQYQHRMNPSGHHQNGGGNFQGPSQRGQYDSSNTGRRNYETMSSERRQNIDQFAYSKPSFPPIEQRIQRMENPYGTTHTQENFLRSKPMTNPTMALENNSGFGQQGEQPSFIQTLKNRHQNNRPNFLNSSNNEQNPRFPLGSGPNFSMGGMPIDQAYQLNSLGGSMMTEVENNSSGIFNQTSHNNSLPVGGSFWTSPPTSNFNFQSTSKNGLHSQLKEAESNLAVRLPQVSINQDEIDSIIQNIGL